MYKLLVIIDVICVFLSNKDSELNRIEKKNWTRGFKSFDKSEKCDDKLLGTIGSSPTSKISD